MQLVVDTNILLAALLKPSVTQRLLLSPSVSLYSPEFSLEEIQKHLPELAKRIGKSQEEVKIALQVILSRVQILPKQEYGQFKTKALNALTDKNDWPFLATAIKLDCAIWSNDKAFKKQKISKAYSTHELLKHILRKQEK